MESLNKCTTNYKLPISMQFKECVFAKFIYNLQAWNMEPMKFAMAKLKKKISQGRNEKIIDGN